MPSLSITWHTMKDERVCTVCQALEGYTWTFECGKDSMDGTLFHPSFGVVWNMSEGSAAHGHDSGTCRCHITHDIHLADVIARLTRIRNNIKAS